MGRGQGDKSHRIDYKKKQNMSKIQVMALNFILLWLFWYIRWCVWVCVGVHAYIFSLMISIADKKFPVE